MILVNGRKYRNPKYVLWKDSNHKMVYILFIFEFMMISKSECYGSIRWNDECGLIIVVHHHQEQKSRLHAEIILGILYIKIHSFIQWVEQVKDDRQRVSFCDVLCVLCMRYIHDPTFHSHRRRGIYHPWLRFVVSVACCGGGMAIGMDCCSQLSPPPAW